ncbi:MAG: glycosyltransferase family 4 protein [Bacteroidota bacterium]|nr:glycosyltransferase family 4 protein [Bacteroidota bacterium]
MEREKLLFIYPKLFTFVRTDIELLSSHYHIITVDQNWGNKFLLPFNLLYQFFFLLFNIHKAHKILISFGGYWSLLPSFLGNFFGKKVSIIVHGTDCVHFPQIKYGSLRNPLVRWFIHKTYKLVDIILPVSESLVYTENNYYTERKLEFGYNYHLDNIQTPYKVVPNGLIINDWQRDDVEKINNTFITVMNASQLKRKGADIIIEAAKHSPHYTFYFAGIDTINSISENVICLGKLSPKELKHWYSKTQFYLQLSNFEGFGVAICEAMLCNCIPIVSNVNFLPYIVGESGFVLKKRDSQQLKDLIEVAMKSDINTLEAKARKRIIEEFSASRRKEMLINVIK